MVFSSKQFSWADITIAFGGRILDGATEVEYAIKQDKDVLRGRGNNPYEIMRGNKSYDGKIVVWQSELEAMVRDSESKDILDLRFDIVVSYIPLDGGIPVTDILSDCEFTEYKKGMKQGDKNMLVELPIIFLKVKNQQ